MKQQDFFRLSLLAIFLQACGGGKGAQSSTNQSLPSPPPAENHSSSPLNLDSFPSSEKVNPDTHSTQKTKADDDALTSPSPQKVSSNLNTLPTPIEEEDSPTSKPGAPTNGTIAHATTSNTKNIPRPKIHRSLANELEEAYQEGRVASDSSRVESLDELPGYQAYILNLHFKDHSEKKIGVYVQDEKINQLRDQKTKLTNLFQGPNDPQQLKKIMAEEIPKIMAALVNTSKIGNTNFQNCVGHTVLGLDNHELTITEEEHEALKISLMALAKKIVTEALEVENLIDDGGADTSIGMRHSQGGEIDPSPYGGIRLPINLPIFVKMNKASQAHNISNFLKVGQTLWGTKQKFNSQNLSLESVDFITNVTLKNIFLEAKISTSKNTFDSHRSQYTIGFDFVKQGVTPFVQIVSDRYNRMFCGITVDAYKKNCSFFSYSLVTTAKIGKLLKETNATFGTLNAQGSIDMYNGLSLSSSMKLSPTMRSEIKLSVEFHH